MSKYNFELKIKAKYYIKLLTERKKKIYNLFVKKWILRRKKLRKWLSKEN